MQNTLNGSSIIISFTVNIRLNVRLKYAMNRCVTEDALSLTLAEMCFNFDFYFNTLRMGLCFVHPFGWECVRVCVDSAHISYYELVHLLLARIPYIVS